MQQSSNNIDARELSRIRRAAMLDGARAVATGFVAFTVWGVVTGVAMVKSGLSIGAALAMSPIVYAGSAQLTSLPLIAAGAPLWLIFTAGVIVNLRFVIFGAALHPYFRNIHWPKRLLLGYLSVDVSFVAFMPRYVDASNKGTVEQHWFYVGAVGSTWIIWQITSVIGIALASFVPTSWSLDFAAILALLAILMPLVNNRPVYVSMLVTAVVAWLTQPLPLRLGLLIAVIAGILGGMWAESRLRRERAK
ncbi:branched-chain amino acid ABC transporter permease [Orrella sp. NBD-18]|uniref:Branched-chain amino acid ABC transporter permease n=2 Tax=Sheuella amnicola TaxID=2707330 RepID=A0A6B2QYG9_9BURK|nr:branched-chain amino acid ABC transporter permease [Sheuella amnicola]HBI82646.1 hypothetical protein [Alcaligenaceae bacterium]